MLSLPSAWLDELNDQPAWWPIPMARPRCFFTSKVIPL